MARRPPETPRVGKSAFKDGMTRRLAKYQQEALLGRLSSWKRWKTFVDKFGKLQTGSKWFWDPPAWLVANFSQHVSASGPTAARGSAANFKWMQKILRVNLKFSDELVIPFTLIPRAHRSRQKVPLGIKVPAHFDLLACGGNPFVAHIAGLSLFLAYGVLREAHLQRSSLKKETETGFLFTCREGKSSWGKPFEWFLPKGSLSGLPVASAVVKNLAPCSSQSNSPFLFRGFEPTSFDPISAVAWSPRKLTYAASKSARWACLGLHPLCLPRRGRYADNFVLCEASPPIGRGRSWSFSA